MRKKLVLLLAAAILIGCGAAALPAGPFNGFQAAGAARFDQMYVFSAPERLVVAEASGKVLADISDESDVFVNKSLTAYCVRDTRLLVVLPDAAGDYGITVSGISGDGLEITAYAYDGAMSVKRYRVDARAGEVRFMLHARKQDGAGLFLLDDGGVESPLREAPQQRDWREYLTRRGLSEDEAGACVRLLEAELIDEEWLARASEPLSVEPFCALMTSAARTAAEDAEPEPLAAPDGEPLTVGLAVGLTDRLLARLGACNPYTLWDWAISPEDAARLSENGATATLSYTCGVCRETDAQAPLTPGAAALMASRFIDAARACRARDQMIRNIARTCRESLDWRDMPEAGMVDGGSSGLARMGVWTPDESAYGLIYADPGDYLLPRLSTLLKARGEDFGTSDIRLAVWPEMGGVCADAEGAVYRWMPVAFAGAEGQPDDLAVMLSLCVAREGIARDYMRGRGLKWQGGDATAEYYLVADPDVVRAFLDQSAALSLPAESLPANYETLSRGSSGENVRRLQTALIRLGYLQSAASGAYGRGTAEAVRDFQKAEGLEPTGMADASTLKRLYAVMSDAPIFEHWLESCACDTDAAEKALSREGARPEALDAIID